MAHIEVFTPKYTQTAGWPDLEACISALPICWQTGAEEIKVLMEGETHGRFYSVKDVMRHLAVDPDKSSFFGLGAVDEEHGRNLTPGRHLPHGWALF